MNYIARMGMGTAMGMNELLLLLLLLMRKRLEWHCHIQTLQGHCT